MRYIRSVAPGVWEGALLLSPGRYRFLLRVDGSRWVVPAGVPVERDSAGMVAVLIVR